MNKQELESKVARLESVNDVLVTEIEYLDGLMRMVGFSRGIETVKATAHEIIKRGLNIEEAINLQDE